MKKKLAIIGAGIAGLTLANLINKNSEHEFMLYEKDESLSLDEGYGIQLSTNSTKILNKIGFNKINDEKIFYPKGVEFYCIQNKKICDLNLEQFNTQENRYTTLQRSTLIEFLKDEVYTQHLRFGKKIKEVSELIAIRTIIKSRSGLNIDDEKISLMMGKNCHLVIYPINKNKELNVVCIIRDKKYDPDNVRSLVDKVISQNPDLEKIFKGELKSWPLYFTPRILPSSNSKVFYIGDAFNGFLPTLAQGAGQSIESAYELFNLINEDKTDAQNAYFKARSKRAKIIRKRSNFNFFVFHFSSATMQAIRNFFMKFLVKRKSFISYYLGTVYKN